MSHKIIIVMLDVQAEPAKVGTSEQEVVSTELVSMGTQVEAEMISTGTQVELESPEVISSSVQVPEPTPTDDRLETIEKLAEVAQQVGLSYNFELLASFVSSGSVGFLKPVT